MLKEFKEFAIKGNIVDVAVGIIIGVAFGAIIKSFVDDILMPPIGLLLGNVDFSNLFLTLKVGSIPGPYDSLAAAKATGAVTVNYGAFINTVISFIIIAFSVFLAVSQINSIRRREEKTPAPNTAKACPFCTMQIPLAAIRCPQCTSDLRSKDKNG